MPRDSRESCATRRIAAVSKETGGFLSYRLLQTIANEMENQEKVISSKVTCSEGFFFF